LIAYLKESRVLEKMHLLSKTVLFAMPLVAFASFFVGRALMTLNLDNVWVAATESFDAIFLAWLLVAALHGAKTRYDTFLSWSPLVYLGKISYGIYVYHVLVIIVVSPLLLTWGLSETHYDFIRLGILLVLTVAMASLSWHWLEQPFLAWKSSLASSPEPRPRVPVRDLSLQTR
jgi:peptidoglycan/LPS O-acetylase OafA/YrhL